MICCAVPSPAGTAGLGSVCDDDDGGDGDDDDPGASVWGIGFSEEEDGSDRGITSMASSPLMAFICDCV